MLKIFPLRLNSILLLLELPFSSLGGLMRTLMVTAVRFHLTDLILHVFHDGLQPMSSLGLVVTLPLSAFASRLILTLSWPPLSLPYHQRMTRNFLAQDFNILPVNLKLRGSNLCLARLLTSHAPLLQRHLVQPATTILTALGNNPKGVPPLNGKKKVPILLSYAKSVVALPRHHPKKLAMPVFNITLQTIHQERPTKPGLKIDPLMPFLSSELISFTIPSSNREGRKTLKSPDRLATKTPEFPPSSVS
ncbi:uncharacterized protein G2W53_028864 [Senna tora]|uniref:Uncharacterized protein n=1 Tax=Senna tora TaxID=362788 RepID=A0A834W961_9FABA|nr:uncharacterized protein G2W53_028864 [Senna tora]